MINKANLVLAAILSFMVGFIASSRQIHDFFVTPIVERRIDEVITYEGINSDVEIVDPKTKKLVKYELINVFDKKVYLDVPQDQPQYLIEKSSDWHKYHVEVHLHERNPK